MAGCVPPTDSIASTCDHGRPHRRPAIRHFSVFCSEFPVQRVQIVVTHPSGLTHRAHDHRCLDPRPGRLGGAFRLAGKRTTRTAAPGLLRAHLGSVVRGVFVFVGPRLPVYVQRQSRRASSSSGEVRWARAATGRGVAGSKPPAATPLPFFFLFLFCCPLSCFSVSGLGLGTRNSEGITRSLLLIGIITKEQVRERRANARTR